jgi:hypothetical protein
MGVAAKLESTLSRLAARARQSQELLRTCAALEARCAELENRMQRLKEQQ